MSNLLCTFAFVSIVYLVNADSVEYAPIVHTKSGPVRGLVQESQHGHKVHFYHGVRYGRAQRFAKPKKTEPWTEVYNATIFRDACVQFGAQHGSTSQPGNTKTESEDCLFLNVWRPQIEKTNRTVMVFIHGGAFQGGTIFTTSLDGRYMADQGNVVVVSINYRLGPFGFLYGGTDDAPGNAGFYDQILALQWLHDNIALFSGDPNKVTIFGESAGSLSVGALILSPLAKGLFKRAIMQSGAPNAIAFRDSSSDALAKTKMLAHRLDCPTTKMDDAIKCLRTKPIEQFINATVSGSFLTNDFLFMIVYGDQLLPIEPVHALKSGKFNHDIDVLYGVTANEGSGFVIALLPQVMSSQFNRTKSTLKNDIFALMSVKSKLDWNEVADYYISKLHQPTQDGFKETLGNIFGDYHLICPAIQFAEQMSIMAPSNNYYAYRLTKRVQNPNVTIPAWMGVLHGDDLPYLFDIPSVKQDEAAVRLSNDMIQAWTNFAKTGHPGKMDSVEWTAAVNNSTSDHTTEYFNLDSSNYKIVKKYYSEICNVFWKPRIFV